MQFEPQQKIIAPILNEAAPDFVVIPTCCGLIVLNTRDFEGATDRSSTQTAAKHPELGLKIHQVMSTSAFTRIIRQILRPVIRLPIVAALVAAASS